MRTEMRRPQAAFKRPDGSSLDRQTIWCDLTLGEKSVEQQFTSDEFHSERSGSGVHLLKDRLNLLTLGVRQLEFCSERGNMFRAGIAVKLSRFRHPHAFSVDQCGNVLRRECLDRRGVLTRVR